MKLLISFIFIILLIKNSFSQNLFYQDVFRGGVSWYTYGNNCTGFEDNGFFKSNIPPNSSIRKALLFITAEGKDSITIFLDNKKYLLDSSNSISSEFLSLVSHSNYEAEIYCLEISNPSFYDVNNIPINIQRFYERLMDYKVRFTSPTLAIFFNNSNYPKISTSIITNNQDVAPINNYSIENINPINNTYPVSLSAVTAYICNTVLDGSFVYANNNLLGLIGGLDSNTTHICSGVYGCYTHYNNISYGLDDDTPDSLMSGTDVLADIKNYVNYGDNNLDVRFEYKEVNNPAGDPLTNPIRYLSLTYSTKCDTLRSYVTTSDTTVCAGEPLELKIGGDSTYTYYWRYKGNVVSADTIINISPNENRLYSVLVTDTAGCSKTEIINIKVNPLPNVYTHTKNAICPHQNGVVVIDSTNGIAPPFLYKKDNGSWQTAPVFANLPTGDYNIQAIDTNGCISNNTMSISSVNNTEANFSFTEPLPIVPSSINFTNTSTNSTEYQWFINGNLVNTTTDLNHFFETPNVYNITLVSSKSNHLCTDTTSKTIALSKNSNLYLPSVWSKDNPLTLYSYGYKEITITLTNNLGQIIHKKTTTITNGSNAIINENEISRGVYYYQITATENNLNKVSITGKVLKM